ncbi:MAG: trypsin-like peptidase domain-containing protein [Nitrospirota bacterium]|nr:trypsin-like peptidase domain-containing protein [Nitrospirota bacterium]
MNSFPTRRFRRLVLTLICLNLSGGSLWLGEGRSEAQPRPVTPAHELSPEERSTIAVFERSARSVVFITNTGIRRDMFSLNLFEVPQGSGSGFVWDKAGHVVTNFHVVYGADQINVIMADRTDHKAKVVGVDPDHDLAVLQIKALPDVLAPIPIGSSNELRVGQKVLAIGNPFGLDHTLTTGVVSALGRTIKSMTERTIDGVIQTDAAINPGNSGGPLLDGAGRLIGINTQIISPSGAYAGIGFAVPVDTINRIVPELIQHGKLIKPGLGLTLIPDAMARQWGIKGLVVGRVLRGGAAERAGLKGARESYGGRIELGDIIVGIDGRAVSELDEFLSVLDRHKVGDRISVEYLRDGKRYQVTVTLQAVE